MSGTNPRPSTSTSSTARRLPSLRKMGGANPRPSTSPSRPRTSSPGPRTSSLGPRIPPPRAMIAANPRPCISSPGPRIPMSREVTGANLRPAAFPPVPKIPPSRDVLPSIQAVPLSSMSGLHQALLNKVKMQSKKTYVPNLMYSRNIQSNLSTVPEDTSTDLLEPKREPENVENQKKGRRERKLIAGTETFAPETKPQITGANFGVKHESINRSVLKKVFSETIAKKFEGISSSCSENLPVTAPKSRFVPVKDDPKKMNPLLTDMIRAEGSQSPLYLLRLPTHLPYMIEDLESQSKSKTKDTEKICPIQDLLAGQIGKLQVLKSGRVRIVLGKCKFWLHKGVTVNYLQELATVKLDNENKTGDIVSLGQISGRITMIPDAITNLNHL